MVRGEPLNPRPPTTIGERRPSTLRQLAQIQAANRSRRQGPRSTGCCTHQSPNSDRTAQSKRPGRPPEARQTTIRQPGFLTGLAAKRAEPLPGSTMLPRRARSDAGARAGVGQRKYTWSTPYISMTYGCPTCCVQKSHRLRTQVRKCVTQDFSVGVPIPRPGQCHEKRSETAAPI